MEEKRKTANDYGMSYGRTFGDLAYNADYAARNFPGVQQEPVPHPESPSRAPERKNRPKQKALPSLWQYVTPISAACALATVVCMVLCIFGEIQVYTYSSDVDTLRQSVSELKQENVDLTTEHGLSFDLTTVKSVAENAGMAKPSVNQTFFVDLSEADNAVVFTPEEGLFSSIRTGFLTLFHLIGEYFN